MPAWAVVVTDVLAVEEPFEVGILLVAAAAGAPFLVKLVALADGDVLALLFTVVTVRPRKSPGPGRAPPPGGRSHASP